MRIKVQMLIFSHLSDVQEVLGIPLSDRDHKEINTKINFIKWLLIEYPEATLVDVYPEAEFERFQQAEKQRLG